MSKQQLLEKEKYSFEDLEEIMRILRAPDGCPWDGEQTHKTIRNNFIEETYEAVEGIDKNDSHILCEELGDVMLQVVFHAQIAEAENEFTTEDVITGVCKKLILRHPHIFGNVVVADSAEVLKNWDEIKKKEKGQKTAADVVASVSSALPALMRAQKLQSKAVKNDMINLDKKQLCETLLDSAKALSEQVLQAETDVEALLGKLLFSVCGIAALEKVDAENALYNQNEQFCVEILSKKAKK